MAKLLVRRYWPKLGQQVWSKTIYHHVLAYCCECVAIDADLMMNYGLLDILQSAHPKDYSYKYKVHYDYFELMCQTFIRFEKVCAFA